MCIYFSVPSEPFDHIRVVIFMRNDMGILICHTYQCASIRPLRIFILLSFAILLFTQNSQAQSEDNGAWFFISHTQKISNRFDMLADVQVRSADHFTNLSALLLRTAISYNFNQQKSAAIGYAHKGDWEINNGQKIYLPEQRIYEQYLHNFKLQRIEMMCRGRLEQRFVKEDHYKFSQRARILLSAQIPLITDKDFSKGVYVNLQDEVFMNVQNKENVNGNFLDQNRPYISGGYRFNKHLDVEFGYTRWLQRENDGDKTTHVMQLMLTTNL